MYGVKFRDVFNPTPEQKAEREKKLRETRERCIAERDCCVCRHYQCTYTGLGLSIESCMLGHMVRLDGKLGCNDWRLPINERYPGEVFPGEERS